MNFRKLTILTLVFLMSGLVGLTVPENLLAWENPKRWRESREILKILQFQKELKKKHPETFQKRGLGKSSEQSKIRIRGLMGSVSADTISASNSSYYLIWNGWGVGQSVLKYKTSDNEKTFKVVNSFNDISYTIGDKFTITLGVGYAGKGKGTLSASSKDYYSEKFNGNANFGIVGLEIFNIELLLGYRRLEFENKEFERTVYGNIETIDSNFKVKGSLNLYGFGVGFKF